MDGTTAIGWCSVGPRSNYRRVLQHKTLGRDAPEGTWSLNCFYIPAKQRGKGVAAALLAAATAYAFENGAVEIEAYPVTPKAGKMPAAFAYTGVNPMFVKLGYAPLAREGRAVWVLSGNR